MKFKKTVFIAAVLVLFNSLTAFAETSGQTTADITFESGTLTLAEMTSFSFGTQTITAATQNYPAREATVSLDVRDLRGTGEGWTVTVLASTFVSGGFASLPGTSLNFINGSAVSTQPPEKAPTVNAGVTVDCDGVASVPVATAGLNTGLGVWSLQWNGNAENNTNVTLNVPGGFATVGTHTTTVTWTVTVGP